MVSTSTLKGCSDPTRVGYDRTGVGGDSIAERLRAWAYGFRRMGLNLVLVLLRHGTLNLIFPGIKIETVTHLEKSVS